MENRNLFFISVYQNQDSLEKLLSCSKRFTVGRRYNLRCKNNFYYKDGSIKVINCKDPTFRWIRCKEVWYKDGKIHRDDIDQKTGLTFPASIRYDGTQLWYKKGRCHRNDVDPETGLILPAVILTDGSLEWWKKGKIHRNDVDPETGLTLPALIVTNGSQYWYKKGVRFYPS